MGKNGAPFRTANQKIENNQPPMTREIAADIRPPRLPYHPAIQERFGIDKASWKALVEAVFPLATSTDSVVLALSYCKARKLDAFKRNVHIVPIWSKEFGRYVDTIWPGIGELRTTAFRTGQYAGRGETVFGKEITRKVGNAEVTFYEWAQVTVKRLIAGQVVEFVGPKVYWLETYSRQKRDDPTPNSMWLQRPFGQHEKCAEAAALRAAFPEELGNEHTNDEIGVTSEPVTTKAIETKGMAAVEANLGLTPTLPSVTEVIDDQGEIVETPAEEHEPGSDG